MIFFNFRFCECDELIATVRMALATLSVTPINFEWCCIRLDLKFRKVT